MAPGYRHQHGNQNLYGQLNPWAAAQLAAARRRSARSRHAFDTGMPRCNTSRGSYPSNRGEQRNTTNTDGSCVKVELKTKAARIERPTATVQAVRTPMDQLDQKEQTGPHGSRASPSLGMRWQDQKLKHRTLERVNTRLACS